MSVQAISWVLESSEATGAKRLVLISIANHVNDGGHAWPSLTTIAREARVSVPHAKRILSELVHSGHLRRTVNGAPDERIPRDRRPNLYQLVGFGDRGAQDVPPAGGTSDARRGAHLTRDGGHQKHPQTVIDPSTEPSNTCLVGLTLVEAKDDPVAAVFEAWKEATGRTDRVVLDGKRTATIKKALKDYPLHDVLDAVRGLAASPWHMGENPDGKRYTDVGNALGDAGRIEKFRDMHRDPPKRRKPAHRNLIPEGDSYTGPVAL